MDSQEPILTTVKSLPAVIMATCLLLNEVGMKIQLT